MIFLALRGLRTFGAIAVLMLLFALLPDAPSLAGGICPATPAGCPSILNSPAAVAPNINIPFSILGNASTSLVNDVNQALSQLSGQMFANGSGNTFSNVALNSAITFFIIFN